MMYLPFHVVRSRPRLARVAAGLILAAACSAVPGCFNAPPPKGPAVDPELAESANSGRLALARGENDQAVALFKRALDRAREMDNAAEIGRAAYSLSAAYIREGRYDAARSTLREAEAETLRAGTNAADVLLLEAKVAQFRDDPAEALTYADRVETDRASKPDDAHHLQVHVVRGEVALDLSQWDLARTELGKAQKYLDDLGDKANPALRAGVLGLSGRVANASNDPAKAAGLFDRQADLLRQANLYRDMARAEARAGTAYLAAHQPAPAADRLYRAGRSFAGQEDTAEARRLLGMAQSAAEQANDPAIVGRIRTVQESLPTTPETAPSARH